MTSLADAIQTSRPMIEVEIERVLLELYGAGGVGETVAGVDLSGTTAIICLLPVADALRPSWLRIKASTNGLEAARQIGAQTAIAGARGVFKSTSAIWLEEAFSRSMLSVRALNRTIGALAATLPRTCAVDEISSNDWRKLLGIKLGQGAKDRAQDYARRELGQRDDLTHWQRVMRDDNAADAYGIARSILVARDHYQKGNR